MINPKAIDAFLKADRDDWRWIKKAKEDELKDEFSNVPIHTNPYKHQWAALALGVANPAFLFFLDMGLGKAQSLDELVLTPHGWVKMGDLSLGDFVIGSDGNPTQVLGVYPQGEIPVYTVTFSDGAETECCLEHLWSTSTELDAQGNPTFRVRSLDDISKDLYCAEGMPKHRIPLVAPVEFKANNIYGHEKHYNLAATKSARISAQAPNQSNTPKSESSIPQSLLFDSIEQRVTHFTKYCDAFASVSDDGYVYFSSQRVNDFEDIQHLVRSLGGLATMVHAEQNGENLLYVEFSSELPYLRDAFRLTANASLVSIKSYESEPMRFVVGIELVGFKAAQCIRVASEDSLYVTRDFILTHNTKLLLDLFMYRKGRGEAKRALVMVPNATNIMSWVDEIQVHQPSLRGVGLEGSAAERRAMLDLDADIWIINYQGLQSLATNVVNRKRVLDVEAIEAVAARFDMIGMDEIHKCKNPESLTFELCDYLCDAAKYRYGLTGTPFGRNPMDLWAQFFLIDRGESLSHHPQIFKESFFNKTMNNAGFVDWEFDKRKKRLLNRMIQHRSIRYRDSECMDLPSQNFNQVRVAMGKDSARYTREMLEEIQEKAMAGDMDDRQQQENTFMKMRTLASGFVRVYELDDNGKKTKHFDDIVFKDQPKVEALLDLIASMPEDEKLVIFHEFITTGKMIEEALTKAKYKFLSLNATTKDRKAFLHDFRDDDSKRFAVVNSKSGSTGLNLQRANHMVYFESPVSPIDRQQSEKRTHRGGQERPCFYHDLITINSVDERIQDFLKEGKDLMTAIVEQGAGLIASMLETIVSDEKVRKTKKGGLIAKAESKPKAKPKAKAKAKPKAKAAS